jgi:hypothetical protein
LSKTILPFILHLSDGRSVNVTHPELMAIGPSGRTISVYQQDNPLSTINLAQVTNVVVKPDLPVSNMN